MKNPADNKGAVPVFVPACLPATSMPACLHAPSLRADRDRNQPTSFLPVPAPALPACPAKGAEGRQDPPTRKAFLGPLAFTLVN